MKPIYILNRYSDDVRRQRATLDEIRAVVDGKSDDRLAHVEIGPDGDLVTSALTEVELRDIATRLDSERESRFRLLLDDALAIAGRSRELTGVIVGSISIVTVWTEDAPWAERVVEAWAAEHGRELRRGSPPRDGTYWHPDAELVVDGVTVVRLVWPRAEVNTEKAIDAEAANVRAERDTAERELWEF